MLVNDNIVQLTWKNKVGFVYKAKNLEQIRDFQFETLTGEGWGITYDGTHLIVSDGSEYLFFWDPETFEEHHRIRVLDPSGKAVHNLNELEFVKGEVLANVWGSTDIARIDPESGHVLGILDCKSLLKEDMKRGSQQDVFNGIAYDSKSNTLIVTGKFWNSMYRLAIPW